MPFLIIGDSPQAMIGNLSVKDDAFYIANRQAAGFNALWVNLLCAKYTGCRGDGTTFDGIRPFTSPGDSLYTEPAYFARVDAMIRLARKRGWFVFLDPIETGGCSASSRKMASRRIAHTGGSRAEIQELRQHRLDERQRLSDMD